MNLVRRIIETEPAVLVGVLVAACSLVGLQVSDADVSALTQILTVVLPLIGSVVVRQAVTPLARRSDDPCDCEACEIRKAR